jgi:hypothetical protein
MVDATNEVIERLLTPTQAAAAIGVSVRTLQWMDAAGRGLPFKRLSPQIIRYPADGLRAWLKEFAA